MAEIYDKPSSLTSEMMTQYSAIGNDLRFYADQRFKIATAFLVASGLLANVAKDRGSWELALIGIALSCLCFIWDRYTSRWWWSLTKTVEDIEKRGIKDGKLVKGYIKYRELRSAVKLRASHAMQGIYFLSILAWAWWWSWALGVVALMGIVLAIALGKTMRGTSP